MGLTATLAHYAGPVTIAGFRAIDDPDVLGRPLEPHRLQLGTPMLSRPASPLFNGEALPEQVASLHHARIGVPGPAFLAVPGYELGSFGLLQREGRVLVNNEVQPHDFNGHFKAAGMPPHWARGLLRPDAEIVECDEPIGVVLNAHLIYGHFLLEMMARVHLMAELAALGRPLRVALPSDAPRWVHDFVGLYFGPDRILAYDSQHQRVRARCFVLPGMMMRHYLLHPQMNLVVQRVLERFADAQSPHPDARRLYLSRRRHEGWHALANEAEVEATLIDAGFTVVHPQELSLSAQFALFREAECIVAPYSSAAHNALFAPHGTPVLCFGWMNRCQSGIAALRGQPMAYLADSDGAVVFPPPDRPPGVFRQHIDCRSLASGLPAFLRFAELSGARMGGADRTRPDTVTLDAPALMRAPWHYGWDGAAPAAEKLVFLPDGRIGGYSHPNEQSWVLRAGVLSILDGQARTTVTFTRVQQAGGSIVLRGAYLLDPSAGIVLRLERTG